MITVAEGLRWTAARLEPPWGYESDSRRSPKAVQRGTTRKEQSQFETCLFVALISIVAAGLHGQVHAAILNARIALFKQKMSIYLQFPVLEAAFSKVLFGALCATTSMITHLGMPRYTHHSDFAAREQRA